MIYVFFLGLIILATIGLGIYYYFQPSIEAANKKIKWIMGANALLFITGIFMAVISIFSGAGFSAVSAVQAAEPVIVNNSAGLGYIAAAISTGLATIGAGYAVGSVGSSALGAVSENPKILGKTLIFVGLAEGIAIYGLIISILILGRL
ncbi:MAG TPA: ATPase [Clostridiales bacterium UBA8960]|jgi:V/A-type H+-transporting ATPase subunit K|nr:ATPase [Clostridiales bacterium UBA8960]